MQSVYLRAVVVISVPWHPPMDAPCTPLRTSARACLHLRARASVPG